MDNIVRISSKQGNFDTSGTKNLVDFEIPNDGSAYNLAETYVAVNIRHTTTHANNANALYNKHLKLNLDNAESNYVYPSSAMVKNASMFSQSRGKVEDIRKVDSLTTNLTAYTKNLFNKQSSLGQVNYIGMSNFSSAQNQNQLGVLKQSLADSKIKSHEVRIPLKDIFQSANVEAWNTSNYGNTKIHLEMNFDKLQIQDAQTEAEWETRRRFGVGGNALIRTLDAGAANQNRTLATAIDYIDIETAPFWVGMPVRLNGTRGADAGGATAFPENLTRVIESITQNANGTLNLTFDGDIVAAGLTAGHAIFTATVDYYETSTDAAIEISSVELVSMVNNSSQAPASLSYNTFISEEDSYPAQLSINRYYSIEPACRTIMIVFSANGAVSRDRLQNYRLTLDGHDITPRAVERKGSIHKDLVSKAMLNRGVAPKSSIEKIWVADATAGRGFNVGADNYIIAIPCPFVNRTQKLGVELTAENGQTLGGSHIIYKEVMKNI